MKFGSAAVCRAPGFDANTAPAMQALHSYHVPRIALIASASQFHTATSHPGLCRGRPSWPAPSVSSGVATQSVPCDGSKPGRPPLAPTISPLCLDSVPAGATLLAADLCALASRGPLPSGEPTACGNRPTTYRHDAYLTPRPIGTDHTRSRRLGRGAARGGMSQDRWNGRLGGHSETASLFSWVG